MERNDILKSLGFTNRFLQALEEFEKTVPNVYYDVPFYDVQDNIVSLDHTSQLIIKQPNDGYNQNIIVKQA